MASYLEELYLSVAEIMPEYVGSTCPEVVLQLHPSAEPVDGDDMGRLVAPIHEEGALGDELRFLPPGTIHDLWHNYVDLHPECRVSRSLFYIVLNEQLKKNCIPHRATAWCLRHVREAQTDHSEFVQ